jgi:predicted GNAT family N-acyltransferase
MSNIKIYRINKLSAAQKKEIMELVGNVFGIIKLPKIDFHYLLSNSNELMGYCAINKRIIEIDNKEINVNILGMLCIRKNIQRNGMGSMLLEFVKKDVCTINNYGIILNCGKKIQKFYLRNGFIKISDNAKYIRNKMVEIDSDPVYYFGDQISLNNYEVINLGEDF